VRRRILFYVQHLLGIGHLVRSARIARSLAGHGFAVDFVVGGEPVPGIDVGDAVLTQLPPARAAAGFSGLLDERGDPMSEAAKAERRDRLLALFEARAPDILLIEAFPFGRRQMDFELLPLLDRARALARRPRIVVSVRDILQRNRKPRRDRETVEIVERYVDLVLVHGDPRLARLADSFPPAERFADRIAYTGLVGPDPGAPAPSDHHAVIVSAGGGAVGERLIRAALAARPLTSLREAPWLVVTGPNLPAATEAELRRSAGPSVSIARFAPDLPQRLRTAALSISQAGYNTVADLLAACCRPVLVPFAAGGETEQSDRARLLQARGLAVVLDEAALDGRALAAAIGEALRLAPRRADLDLNGAATTARLLATQLAMR
jgi:predicted glycosyltransferase